MKVPSTYLCMEKAGCPTWLEACDRFMSGKMHVCGENKVAKALHCLWHTQPKQSQTKYSTISSSGATLLRLPLATLIFASCREGVILINLVIPVLSGGKSGLWQLTFV